MHVSHEGDLTLGPSNGPQSETDEAAALRGPESLCSGYQCGILLCVFNPPWKRQALNTK